MPSVCFSRRKCHKLKKENQRTYSHIMSGISSQSSPTIPDFLPTPSFYDSSDETSSLLTKPSSTVKPVLTRQECTTTLLSPAVTPVLGTPGVMGNSEESTSTNVGIEESGVRSVPDLDMQHYRYLPSAAGIRYSTASVTSYLVPTAAAGRCPCERRQSHSLGRSASRESVRSSQPPPTVLLTTSPSSRIIRQSSQPETTCPGHCCHHLHHHSSSTPGPSSSLRQLRDPTDCIAGIAADSLRINGAFRPFKQVNSMTDSFVICILYLKL